jgi:hypothetical protein
MDIDGFRATLAAVKAGEGARVNYEAFRLLFPPGVSDRGAQNAAKNLARQAGLRFQNRPDDGAVWFYRDA